MYKEYFKELKEKIKSNDYTIIEKLDEYKIENNLYEQITNHGLYLWYNDSCDPRIDTIKNIIIPNNLERTFSFNDYEFVEIAKIFSYIKYELFGLIDLKKEDFTEKNITKYSSKKMKEILNIKKIDYNSNNKKKLIKILLDNKDLIYTNNYILQSKKEPEVIEFV